MRIDPISNGIVIDHIAAGRGMQLYKLLGLEQLTRIKERWFREGLRQRIRLYARYLMLLGKPELDCGSVRCAFARSLPANELEAAQTLKQLEGIVKPDRLAVKAEQVIGL